MLRCQQAVCRRLHQHLCRITHHSYTIRYIFHHNRTSTNSYIVANFYALADNRVGSDKCVAAYLHITTQHSTRNNQNRLLHIHGQYW